MTIKEIVSLLRTTIKQQSDDSPYSDRYLWQLFTIQKSKLIYRRLNQFKHVNEQNYVSFCMELEKAKSHECGCIIKGCDVLKTKHQLPRLISRRNTNTLSVYDLNWNRIDYINQFDLESYLDYDPIFQNKTLYSIVNNRVIIWNNLDIEFIQVKAIWEDITEIDAVQYCKDNDSFANTCIDVFNKDVGLDKDLIDAAIKETLNLLNIPLSLQEDETNDTSDTIKI